MDIVLNPTLQTIHCSSAGRSGLLAQFLAPDPQLATGVGAWVDRLVSTAASLDIMLNTRDARSLFAAPIEDLEDVCAKSHPSQLRGYGAMDGATSQVLDQWCANVTRCLSILVRVAQHLSRPPETCPAGDQLFPETVALSRYQRSALGAYLQVANDALAALLGLLHLARPPYAPLFSSSLTAADLARCREACTDLDSLFAWGQRWVGETPIDRRRLMVREHLDDGQTALTLLFEGTSDRHRRQCVAKLLIGLADLKRRV